MSAADEAVLRRAQLRIAAAMLAEIPYSAPPGPTTDKKETIQSEQVPPTESGTTTPKFCPVDSRCRFPLALGGAAADHAAQEQWYSSHAHCLMCNVHNNSPCAAPYFVYNMHRDVVDGILSSSPRRKALEHSRAGRLRPPLASQSTVRTWIDMFLSTAVSSCHTDHIVEMFSDARLAAAEAQRDSFIQKAKQHAGSTEAAATPKQTPRAAATNGTSTADAHFAAVLRRAHRDLLVDMSVLEAAQRVATTATQAAEASKDQDDVIHAIAEELAPFAKTQQLTPCACLVDMAVALRDLRDTRAGMAVHGASTLDRAYKHDTAAALGEEEEEALEEEEQFSGAGPREIMHGMPKPASGVWLEADGSLHAPKPCFKCPISEKLLLADISQTLHELLCESGDLDRDSR